MTSQTMETVDLVGSSGNRLVGEVGGPEDGPPVILAHGGGQTRHAWKRTGEEMTNAGFRVLAYDQRGHGDSDWSEEGDYTLGTFAEDMLRVVDWIGGKPVLVGASLGGQSALLAEGESDHQVASALVLVDVTPRIQREGTERIRAFMEAYPDGFESLDQAADAVAAYASHRPRPKDPSGLAKNLRQKDGRWRWHWDPLFVEAIEEKLSDETRDRQLDAARAVTVPTLLVRGGVSDVVAEEGVKEFLGIVPGAEYIDVPRAGHMVAGDQNDAFSASVLQFIERVAG
jgi:pimeloyl-ACP methyl ester carboxylesterase